MVITHRLTVEEYLALPEVKPYLEYDNGEVRQKMAPDRNHVALADELAFALHAYRKQHGGFSGPEPRARFDDEEAVRFFLPDVAYWAPGREPGGRILTPPTLAIEIRSPDESLASQREKCRFYRAHGVDACWLVDPGTRTVEVFEGGDDGRPLAAGETLTSAFLPGFSLAVSDLFAALS